MSVGEKIAASPDFTVHERPVPASIHDWQKRTFAEQNDSG
jgi:hypothetical protein